MVAGDWMDDMRALLQLKIKGTKSRGHRETAAEPYSGVVWRRTPEARC